jgi:hypothetical protein
LLRQRLRALDRRLAGLCCQFRRDALADEHCLDFRQPPWDRSDSSEHDSGATAHLLAVQLQHDGGITRSPEGPADIKPAKDPATAVNPFENSYGQWQAVENAGLALAEASRLLTVPGRKCANGLNVPLSNPDWPGLVQGLREAGLKVYAAAKAKNMDQILDAADVMTTACSNCHEKYRDKGGLQDRCK